MQLAVDNPNRDHNSMEECILMNTTVADLLYKSNFIALQKLAVPSLIMVVRREFSYPDIGWKSAKNE